MPAIDPRINFVVKCPSTATKQQDNASGRKEFFGALGKAADVELLNELDGGVARGLRSLASTSDAIRSGDTRSAIAQASISADASGPNLVLGEVGINPVQAEKVGRFNPGVLNRGRAEAKVVYDKVKGGNFKLKDVPNAFQNLQNLSSLAKGIYTETITPATMEVCGAKPWATALIRYAPKYKFMFVVQFTFKDEYKDWDKPANHMAFVVKTSTRPNVNIEHEEINMYNFWTRVAKRTVYEPITMRFLDDQKNSTHFLMNNYIKALSPIARTRTKFDGAGMSNHEYFEDRGMSNGSDKSASLTKLKGDNTSIFDEIRVFHIYDYGRYMSVSTYVNPKIMHINFDELDMAEGAVGNEIEIQFAYDAVNILDRYDVKSHQEKLASITGGGIGSELLNIVPVYPPGPATAEGGGNEAGQVDTLVPLDQLDIEDAALLLPTGQNLADGLNNALTSVSDLTGGITLPEIPPIIPGIPEAPTLPDLSLGSLKSFKI